MSDDADEVMNGGEMEKLVETSDDALEASTTVSEEKQEEVTVIPPDDTDDVQDETLSDNMNERHTEKEEEAISSVDANNNEILASPDADGEVAKNNPMEDKAQEFRSKGANIYSSSKEG